MWKKYKFEWKFFSSAVAGVIQQIGGKSIKLSEFLRGCEDNAGGQKTTQKKPRRGIEPRTYRLRSGCSTS